MNCQPIIIIGAPRSGTNMLRDVLTKLPGFGTWPCDEINYIWRHGNARNPTDALRPEQATARSSLAIRHAFERLADRNRLSHVVEKTCANSLRVPFVEAVIPEARFIYLVRDGRDAASSAMDRWRAHLDLPYLARKARFVPISDMPYYAMKYLLNRLHRVASRGQHLATWGPRFEGMQEILDAKGLAGVCAAQWARCVDEADRAFSSMAQRGVRVHRIYYEEFVASPEKEARRLAEYVEIDVAPESLRDSVVKITDRNVGKWRTKLDDPDLEVALPILRLGLERHGYI